MEKKIIVTKGGTVTLTMSEELYKHLCNECFTCFDRMVRTTPVGILKNNVPGIAILMASLRVYDNPKSGQGFTVILNEEV